MSSLWRISTMDEMKVYVLIASKLIANYDDMYESENDKVVAVTDSLERAEELKEEFNNSPSNVGLWGITVVTDIKELELNQLINE